ncbi:4'-phosphopantetheinyl transferase family protein [Dyadobacter psychrotolerans]|uniref:4'-phosphopantetheinyl transferase superfamily protein n=1 Tax=Dyadobacter psychrotolerans TaxID=2541721 RepID=A0A4R5DZ48_9BACT|nr:4'-phosphopantetheinyl transferase superfamily protein [Dyadobacter psychrotolerans]TDE16705.1 4'-phosphopantetheinyl transferase superfamily protein [Dyadobacter psychrotolerans]
MPLVHSEKIEENSTLLLWSLTESETELRESLGFTYNFGDLESISHPQKIREWLASRLLIKTLAEQSGRFYEGTHKDEHGKAFLVNNDSHISLTHTADYVAAVINLSSPVGIDMEKMSDKLQRTSRKFLSEEEQLRAGQDLTALCIYWCAKEAIYKLYGKKKISFKDSIFIEAFSENDVQISAVLTDPEEKVTVHSPVHLRWFGDHCLAIAI